MRQAQYHWSRTPPTPVRQVCQPMVQVKQGHGTGGGGGGGGDGGVLCVKQKQDID